MSDTITKHNGVTEFAEFRKFGEDELFQTTMAELRKGINEYADSLEAKGFEKGRLAGRAEGLAEAEENARTRLMEKIAIARGPVGSAKTDATRGKSPADLAKRARQLQDAALADGKELHNIEAVRQAYAEAGVPRDPQREVLSAPRTSPPAAVGESPANPQNAKTAEPWGGQWGWGKWGWKWKQGASA